MYPIIQLELQDKFVKQDFFCGILAGVCDSKLEWEDFDIFVEVALKDKPTPVEPVPTLKSTYKILQMNDMHLDFKYTPGSSIACGSLSQCCNNRSGDAKNATDAAGYWGSPGSICDIPEYTWRQAMDFVKETIKPDYVFWLGDNTDHDIANPDVERHLSFNSFMADYLKKTWGNEFPVFPILGNHEMLPIDNHDFWMKDKNDIVKRTAEYWEGILPDEPLAELKENGYYSYLLPGRKVRLVNLFVAFDDDLNFSLWKMLYDPGNQIEWLRSVLTEAEKNGEAVFILRHIPVGEGALAGTRHILPLFDRFANIIRAVFSGHTHSDQWTYIRDSKGNFICPEWIGPSVTTYNTGGYPSLRVYEIDSDTNVVLDYEQFRLDLDKYNANPDRNIKLVWDSVYKFKTEYGMADTSFKSYEALDVKRAASDPEFMATYNKNFYGGVAHDMTLNNQKQYACNRFSNPVDIDACLGDTPKTGYQKYADLFFKNYLVTKKTNTKN